MTMWCQFLFKLCMSGVSFYLSYVIMYDYKENYVVHIAIVSYAINCMHFFKHKQLRSEKCKNIYIYKKKIACVNMCVRACVPPIKFFPPTQPPPFTSPKPTATTTNMHHHFFPQIRVTSQNRIPSHPAPPPPPPSPPASPKTHSLQCENNGYNHHQHGIGVHTHCSLW